MNVRVSQSRYLRTVGSETPSERAGSAALQIWPWKCASIAQNRRTVTAGALRPSCGRSRSRNVAIDVLVVGPDNGIKVQAALAPTARKHRRKIQASVFTSDAFARLAHEGDLLVEDVKRNARIDLHGSWHAATQP